MGIVGAVTDCEDTDMAQILDEKKERYGIYFTVVRWLTHGIVWRRGTKRFDWIFQSSTGDSTNSDANCTDGHSRLTNTYAVDVPGKPIPFAAVQRYPPSLVLLVITRSSLLSSDKITDWLPSVVQVTFGAGFPDVRHVSVMVSLWLTVTFPGITWAVGWSIDKRFEKCIPSKSSLIFYWSWSFNFNWSKFH